MNISAIQYRRLEFRDYDPEQLRAVVNGSDMEHTILAPGACSAMVQQFRTGRLEVDVGFYHFPVVARGQFPAGKLCISFCWGRPQLGAWANGFHLDEASVQVFAEGTELLYRAGSRIGWMVLAVSREELQAEALRRVGRELSLPETGCWSHSVPRDLALQLPDLVLKAGSRLEMQPGDRALADQRLLGACVDAIASVDPAMGHEVRKRAHHRFDTVHRADAVMRHFVGDGYSSDRLCRSLGVTERSLQMHFKDAFGVNPKAWYQRLALNRAHNELLHRPHHDNLVTQVALDCGFDHLGRFAQSYRELFGRLPSETVRTRLETRSRG